MMSNDLFEQNEDTNKDYLAELVGEGKKFKDAQALAKGKHEADLTVNLMKERLDELRADYQKLHETREAGATLKDLVDQIKTKQSDSHFTPQANDLNVQPKTEDLKETVKAMLAEEKAQERATSNLSIVQQKLKERYGDKYQTVLAEQRDALNLTTEEINNIARRSPEAFFRVMGLAETNNQDNVFQAPPRSERRTDTFAPSSNQRTWSYYQNLKKSDRALYYSPKIFNQMLRDAETLGEKFKDGDYSAFGD